MDNLLGYNRKNISYPDIGGTDTQIETPKRNTCMRPMIQFALVVALCFSACSSSNDDATETNITELPCNADGDCPKSSPCVFTRDSVTQIQNAPFCKLESGGSATDTMLPATSCTSDANCVEGSSCLFFVSTGLDAESGFCSIPSYCSRYCMTGADEVRGECQSQNDCDSDAFCIQLPCA